jgi:hypothetical protein
LELGAPNRYHYVGQECIGESRTVYGFRAI